ncbi:MAG TPA: hypothetical protein VMB85_00610 [Bryobacteraceae bacterium]|nr:hypothetical protein [Bryobacteraceae bacterium]
MRAAAAPQPVASLEKIAGAAEKTEADAGALAPAAVVTTTLTLVKRR